MKLITTISVIVLLATAGRVATRSVRMTAIDHELSLGYATDRWGEPNPANPPGPDAGELWRAEQVAHDDRTTLLFLAVSVLPAVWITYVCVQRYRSHPGRIAMLLVAAIFLPLVHGCGSESSTKQTSALTVPDAKDLTIVCFHDNKDLPPLKFVVSNAKQRADIVKSLRDLRWTEPGWPLAEIGMPRPDIDLLLADDAGRVHTYQLFWSGNGLLDQDSGLALGVTDISKLRTHVTSITGLSSTPQGIPDDFQVVATYNAGRSHWSSWDTTILRSGEANQQARTNGQQQTQQFNLTDAEMSDLWAAVQAAFFFQLKEAYESSEIVDDFPSMTLQVTVNGTTHSVSVHAPLEAAGEPDLDLFNKLWIQVLKAVPPPNEEQVPQ
ncbi:MAG: hypothetical protein KDA88_04635 [Planctomycetaceae bacterium]|nr:hypothetical protein [Planctomycetaceae bacterium]